MSPSTAKDHGVNYAKLDKERAAIVKSMEQVTNVPQAQRMYPDPMERGRRLIVDVARRAGETLRTSEDEARARRIKRALGNQPASVGMARSSGKPNLGPV
jgi:hypothetical protein